MPDRCGHVRRDRRTFELFQAEDGFEEFASCILAAKWKNSHLYFTFSYSCCVCFIVGFLIEVVEVVEYRATGVAVRRPRVLERGSICCFLAPPEKVGLLKAS